MSHGEAIFQQGDPPEQVKYGLGATNYYSSSRDPPHTHTPPPEQVYFVSEGQLECEYDPKLDSRAKKRRPSGEAVVTL